MEPPRDEPRGALTRADHVTISLGLLALILGGALLALAPGFTVSVIGAALLGVAGVAFVALAFLLVGESEDRDHRDRAP
jgi:predicted MFS family arabinose efflux permease